MLICGQGDVCSYCNSHGMIIAEEYTGEIRKYNGLFRILVTDKKMFESEYLVLKGEMLQRGYELVSTIYEDTPLIAEYVTRVASTKVESNKGRCKFGFHRVDGEIVPHEGKMAVVRRILEMKDAGYTFREIRKDDMVRHVNGKMLSISTIQLIIKNRKEYEGGE